MVYIQADGSLAAGMLYLRGGPEHRDDHWMMVDKGTGLPVWIDSTLRSARGSLGRNRPPVPQKGNDATMMPFCGCFAGNRAYGIGIKREQAPGRVLRMNMEWRNSS